MKHFLILSISLSFSIISGEKIKAFSNVSDAEYARLPSIYHLDDFDNCLDLSENELYCTTGIKLSPLNEKNPSKIWNIIEEINSVNRSYRHDSIKRGICISKSCPNIPRKFFAKGNGTAELWEELSKCYNQKFKSMGLKTSVINTFCYDKTPPYDIDTLDIIYLFVLVVIIMTTLLSTLYERYLKHFDPETYEDFIQKSNIGRVINSFSILNNWQRLRAESTSDDSKALSSFQGVRVYNVLLIMISHTSMLTLASPILNTKYVEDLTLYTENMLLVNGSLTVQTFFVMSGWLLSYNICVIFSNKKFTTKDIFLAFLNRYLRLTPLLILVIGFNATWIRHLGTGPVWHELVGEEFENCRKNWFTNIIYLNNYWDPGNMCTPQTWYMGADTQLFTLGLIIMMLVLNNRQHANKIFGFFVILGILITFTENYVFNYDAIMRAYPEQFTKAFRNLEEWKHMFIPGHHSISCYVQGLICGYYFYEYRRDNKTVLTSKFSYILWFVFIWTCPLTSIFIGHYFYQDGYVHSRFIGSLYQSLCRYLFGLPISAFLFGFAFGKGGYMRDICSWSAIQSMGKISFCVFLVHLTPMRIYTGLSRSLKYANNYTLFTETLGAFTVAYVFGTIVCIIVEMPISGLQKIIFTNSKKATESLKKTN